jgi:hypothetical protein
MSEILKAISNHGPGILAGGGIIAGITMAWNHVKEVYLKVSGVVIHRANIDSTTYEALRCYCRQHYKAIPSGTLHVVSDYFNFVDKENRVTVPFTSLPSSCYFYIGKNVIYLTPSSISCVRGTVNYKKLIIAATDYFDNVYRYSNSAGSPKVSRYRVEKIIGREKTVGVPSDHKSDASDPDSGSSITGSSSINSNVDYFFDESFKYRRSEYQFERSKHNPFENLYFSDSVNKHIEQARKWYERGTWYTKRGVPWRRGWLLYGPPGTGKSSIAKAIAQDIGIPIYQFMLSTLSNQEFMRAWDKMDRPCMVLLEDLDTVFNKREPITDHKTLSFDTLLNCINGVGICNGIFLIVTTNHIENIDEAMGANTNAQGLSTRPGRIDAVIELSFMDETNRRKLANRILCDWPDLVNKLVDEYIEVTPAQFQEVCIQAAFKQMAQDDEDGNIIEVAFNPADPIYRQNNTVNKCGFDDDEGDYSEPPYV